MTTSLNHYNLDRAHLGIGSKIPIDRINNRRGQYTWLVSVVLELIRLTLGSRTISDSRA